MALTSYQRKYKHLFFDLDHTLWDFETNSKITLLELYEKYDLKSHFESFDLFYEVYQKHNLPLWEAYRKGEIKKEELNINRFHQPFMLNGINSKETAIQFSDDYLARSPLQTTLMPATIKTLNTLKQHYTLHIITNGFKEVQHLKLQRSGLRPYFKNIFISEKIGVSKPHRRFFEEALKCSNAKKSESLIIGDSLEADIKGAKNFGLDHVLFNPTQSKHNEEVMYEISHLNELTSML